MAKIFGLQLKCINGFEGEEGYCSQGKLYLNGKKIGFWSQDFNGAIYDHLEMEPGFSEKKLRDAIDARDHDDEGMALELAMEKLLKMADREKLYKQAMKRGHNSLYLLTDGYHCSSWDGKGIDTKEQFKKLLGQPAIDAAKSKMFKNEVIEEAYYSSLDDFNLYPDKKISLSEVAE